MFFDPLYFLIVGPTVLIAMWASWRVRSLFTRYSSVGVRTGMTGAEAAVAVARAGGADVTVERHQGFLSDHYDPRTRTLRLSPEVYDGRSISSIAVAAHEAGHSIQHVAGYAWLGFRTQMVPICMIGNHPALRWKRSSTTREPLERSIGVITRIIDSALQNSARRFGVPGFD